MLGGRTRNNYLPKSVFPIKERAAIICVCVLIKWVLSCALSKERPHQKKKQMGRNLLAPWLKWSHISEGFSLLVTGAGGRGVPSHIHSQITDDPLSLDLTLGFFIPFYRRIWSFFYIIHSRSLPALHLWGKMMRKIPLHAATTKLLYL